MEISKRHLALLAARKLTKTALAAELGVSATYLMRITPPLPPGPVATQRRSNSKLATSRAGHRTKLAAQVIAGSKSITKAAAEAKCSERTMYRYVWKLSK